MINLDESKCDKKNKTIIDKKQCNSYSIIKKIFSSKNIKLLIDSENISTEAFFNHTAQQNLINDESSDNSNDTRNVLNKQTINIWKFLKYL